MQSYQQKTMRTIPEKLKASIPGCIVTELEDLLKTESIDSLKKLSDRIDSTMFLSNAQRGWARYWLRSELSILCNTSNHYRFMGYSHLGVFITDTPMGGYNAFPVPQENVRRVYMSPFSSLEKLVHWLTINQRATHDILAA
jgi:hypothetical protein